MEIWIKLITEVLAVLVIVIPLVAALQKKSKEAATTMVDLIKAQNWPAVVTKIAEYMATAETLLPNGDDRKAWVMAMIKSAGTVATYEIADADMTRIGELIDSLCAMSKTVNGACDALETTE